MRLFARQESFLAAAPTLVVVALAAVVQALGLAEVVDRRLHDGFVRLAPARAPTPAPGVPDVAVVTIDPRSLRASEPWPWSRVRHAEAVERLRAAGARVIAFDIDFSSPSEEAADTRFAETIAAERDVVLATFSQRQRLTGGAELEIVNRPIPALEQAAAALGSVLVPIDSDGVVRHAPRASPIGGRAIPSLARAALRVAAPESLRPTLDRAAAASDATLIDFRRTWPAIPTVAWVDLMEERFEAERLAGRAVFIGATAAEFQDLWATPVEPALPGVMIQAIAYRTAAAEAMGGTVLRAAPLAWVISGFLALGLATWPRSGLHAGARLALFLGLGGALIIGAWAAYWMAGIAVPLALGIVLLGAQYALGLEALQRRIRATVAAHESSLSALARLGDVTTEGEGAHGADASGGEALALALALLGDVVGARGVVLLRALPRGGLGAQRLEWRPGGGGEDEKLVVDVDQAARVLESRRTTERDDAFQPGARVVYTPLFAGSDRVGVLVVFCHPDRPVDTIQRRTIATVGAQLALTAQNLRLIERLRETFESSIAAVASAVEARDGYTDQHCRRLAAFSSLMGTRLGLPEEEIRAMELGALLHDVGKIGIPDAILNKNGHLDSAERREMQRHPEIGAGIIAPVVGLEPTTLHCVVHHHERWDGTGYPEGLAGEEIPLAARIVSIVDVWDALSTRRPYKKAFSQAEVRDLMLKGRGTQFDPELVDLFFEVLHEQGEEMLELIARSSTQTATES